MAEKSKSPRAGKLYARMVENDPAAQAVWARVRAQAPFWKAELASAVKSFHKHLKALGVTPPEDVEELEQLAMVLGMDPERYYSGEWTAGELASLAEEWVKWETARVERQELKAKLHKKILADRKKKSAQPSPALRKLAKKIQAEHPGKPKIAIALEITGGDRKRALTLLRGLRGDRHKHLLDKRTE